MHGGVSYRKSFHVLYPSWCSVHFFSPNGGFEVHTFCTGMSVLEVGGNFSGWNTTIGCQHRGIPMPIFGISDPNPSTAHWPVCVQSPVDFNPVKIAVAVLGWVITVGTVLLLMYFIFLVKIKTYFRVRNIIYSFLWLVIWIFWGSIAYVFMLYGKASEAFNQKQCKPVQCMDLCTVHDIIAMWTFVEICTSFPL